MLDGRPPAQPAEHATRRLHSAGLTVGALHPAADLAAARLFRLRPVSPSADPVPARP